MLSKSKIKGIIEQRKRNGLSHGGSDEEEYFANNLYGRGATIPREYLDDRSHQDGKGTVSGVIVGASFDDDKGFIKLRVTDSTGITPSLPLRNERAVYFNLKDMSDAEKTNIQKEARERNEIREALHAEEQMGIFHPERVRKR
jgi:hypothetical protein